MPNPARRMGVSPTLGLTTEPVNALIGDCCGPSECSPAACRIDYSSTYPLYGYLLEVTAGLVSEDGAEFMDPLRHYNQGH